MGGGQMKVGDYRDHEKPPRLMTQREKQAQREKNKCAECDSFGIYYNEKRNLYYCQRHSPRRPISEEFALKPIERDKRNSYVISNRIRNLDDETRTKLYNGLHYNPKLKIWSNS